MNITMVQLIKWPNVPAKFSNEANCFYCSTWLHNGKIVWAVYVKINDARFREREMTICWHGYICSLSAHFVHTIWCFTQTIIIYKHWLNSYAIHFNWKCSYGCQFANILHGQHFPFGLISFRFVEKTTNWFCPPKQALSLFECLKLSIYILHELAPRDF